MRLDFDGMYRRLARSSYHARPSAFRQAHAALPVRRLLCEALEDRRMLSIGAIDDPIAANAVAVFQTQDALFAENAGQWANDEVYFGYNKGGTQIYFTDDAVEFGLSRRELKDGYDAEMLDELGRLTPGLDEEAYDYASTHFSLHFDGARATVPVGANLAETTFNYHLGEQTAWVDGVATYKTVVYDDLYGGIDLHAFSQSGQMKYEFHVAPGGDWSQIELTYTGVEGLSLGDDGSLNIETELGPIVDEDLLIYQEIAGERVEVAGHFTLIDQDTYTFTVTGAFDPTQELIIDPNITWGSYLGGVGTEYARGVTTDGSGNVYVCGSTTSTGWGVSGGWDNLLGGVADGYLVKLSSAGGHLWSTYLGGSGPDRAYGVTTDGSANVYVCGRTDSTGWGVSGGWDASLGGISDGYVLKIADPAIPGDANSDRMVDDRDASILGVNWGAQYQLLPGDANRDGVVNAVDLDIVQSHIGIPNARWHDGDFDGDRNVDAGDLAICAEHYGETSGPVRWADGDFNADGIVNDKDAAIMAAHWTTAPPEASEPPASSPQLSDAPEGAALIGPRPASAAPATRRRLSDPREAAREAAFAEASAYSPSREQRLAAAWSHEVARSTARQRLIAPANRLAAARAVDLLMSPVE